MHPFNASPGVFAMWLSHARLSDVQLRWLSSVGRALALAQNFEANCKEILKWCDMAKRYRDGGIASFEECLAHPELLRDAMLRATVQRLSGTHSMPNDTERDILARAVDARNFIAHEGAICALYPPRQPSAIEGVLEDYQRRVRALAAGDSVVSCWSYEFQEREAAPIRLQQTYADDVSSWILEPFF